MHSLLRLWRHQSDRLASRCTVCKHSLKQDTVQHSTAHLAQPRAKHGSSKKHHAISCASSAFGDVDIIAGIPVSPANTAVGNSLWQTLQQQQLNFVPEVQKCLQKLAAESSRPDAQDIQQEGILVSTRRKALLEDVLYYWAVAEAYLADASLQANFRQDTQSLRDQQHTLDQAPQPAAICALYGRGFCDATTY